MCIHSVLCVYVLCVHTFTASCCCMHCNEISMYMMSGWVGGVVLYVCGVVG